MLLRNLYSKAHKQYYYSQGSYTHQVIMNKRCLHFLIILSAISVASSIENDRNALLALRDGFTLGGTPPDDSALNSWNSSLHVCDWKGVMCGRRHQRVTVLNLVQQKLNGVLSPSIGNLTFLRELYLSNNSLHGEIPKQIGYLRRLQYLGQIPIQLGSLSKMIAFYVGRNHLVGEMPNFLRNFSSSIYLDISLNNFHGEIKDSLYGLSKLTFLMLSANNLFGTISSLYNLSSLKALELALNNFTGTLLQDIDVAFPRLQQFTIFVNSFTGTIPCALSNISGLNTIQMGENKFTGGVPDSLGNLKSLSVLRLAYNNLGGGEKSNDLGFIDSLTNCTKLERLFINSNRFGGPIPSSIGNLSSNLQHFVMDKNYITGRIPEAIGELSGLSWIDFGANLLTGTIPDSIGNLANISKFFLNGNKLHGKIPPSIGKLTRLLELDLSTNSLDGIIPSTLGNCKSMLEIDISSNLFGGNLPDDVFSQSGNLYNCNLSHNSFDSRFPSAFGNLRTLRTLDALYNNFIGEIPARLGESLEFLSMAKNYLQGNIPTSLGSLRGLIWVDLSSNNLSGPVPKELASLISLQNLNLSFNQLEGEFPLFKNVTGVSVVGNNKLCGGNSELHLLPCLYPKIVKADSGKDIIAITLSVAAFLSLLLLVFIFVCCRRKHKKDNTDDLNEGYQRISYSELFEATNGFSESNLIGTGSFGDVFVGNLDGGEGKPIAVKVLKLSKHGATKSFITECKVLGNIRHRNLLRIITSCSSLDHKGDDFKALVFNFMRNGNLDSWLHINQHQEARDPLTLAKRLDIAIDVGCALDYLHNCCEAPIVHCDLKPSNILLDDDMVAHVGDFGLAKLLYGVTENISRGEFLSAAVKGTIGYVAPEYGMGAAISPQGDIYSYGILLLELITGKRPTDEMFNNEMGLRSFVERALPVQIKEVVDRCLVTELHEAMAIQKNREQYKLQWEMFLGTFVEVGISCSAQSSKDRMEIQSAIKCLTSIKEKCGIICQV